MGLVNVPEGEEQKRYKCFQCAFSHGKGDVADADSTVESLAVDDASDAQSVHSMSVSGKICECGQQCMCPNAKLLLVRVAEGGLRLHGIFGASAWAAGTVI